MPASPANAGPSNRVFFQLTNQMEAKFSIDKRRANFLLELLESDRFVLPRVQT